jgi:endo-1,4-beta-xylanase
MKRFSKIAIGLATLVAVASCHRYEPLDFNVEKPESVAIQEDIDSYPALKSYINRSAHPNFKFGAGVNLDEYVKKGVMYRLVNKNFDEIAIGYAMKHGAVVQADGSLALDNVKTLLQTAKAAGVSVYGHTLAWHANQNAKYLNGLIAPTIIPSTGGPTWDVVAGANFETDDAASYQYTPGGVGSFTAAGQGAIGQGRALKIVNTAVRTNDWDVQLFFKFSPAVKEGEKYKLKMDVRSDAPATYSTQAHTAPGAYKHYDFFGSISSTSTWATYEKEITVSASTATSTTIAFNLGKTATTFYFDNITLTKYNESGGVSTGKIVITDFESDNLGKTYSMTGNSSSTVENDPKGVSGKVLHVGSSATPTSQSHPKFTVNLSGGVTLGDCVSVTLDLFYG